MQKVEIRNPEQRDDYLNGCVGEVLVCGESGGGPLGETMLVVVPWRIKKHPAMTSDLTGTDIAMVAPNRKDASRSSRGEPDGTYNAVARMTLDPAMNLDHWITLLRVGLP